MKESTRALIAVVAAVALGTAIGASGNVSLVRAADFIAPLGTLWVNAIRMTVIPLVVSLLITGVASAADIKAIGRIGGRTLLTLLLALAIASSPEASRETLTRFFRAFSDAMLTLVRWVILAAPVGVFALVLPLAVHAGGTLAGAIGFYVAAYSSASVA